MWKCSHRQPGETSVIKLPSRRTPSVIQGYTSDIKTIPQRGKDLSTGDGGRTGDICLKPVETEWERKRAAGNRAVMMDFKRAGNG